MPHRNNQLLKLYRLAGYVAYQLLRPLAKRLLKRTRRAYVILQYGDEYLFVYNWFSNGCPSLPGGGIKRTETGQQAIIRETQEELGITLNPDDLSLLSGGTWQTDGLGHHYLIFYQNLGQKPPIRISLAEITYYAWIPRSELVNAKVSTEIIAACKIIA